MSRVAFTALICLALCGCAAANASSAKPWPVRSPTGASRAWCSWRAVQYHTGSGAGFRAFNYRLPRERLAVIILSNIDESELPWIQPLIDRIAEIVTSSDD
jgi:hypothetical protein